MPHTRHYSHAADACEKPKPKPGEPAPAPPPPPPPPGNTRSQFNIVDMIGGDQDFCRLGMTIFEARECHRILCEAIFNDSSNLWHYECDINLVTADVRNAWPVCTLAVTWNPAWPPLEDCSFCVDPDPPCP